MNPPLAIAQPSASVSSQLVELFEEDFRLWASCASAGPRTPQLERLWERAVLAPARAVLARPGKLFRARLVDTAHAIAGGDADRLPVALPLVVEILHAGSLVVDDVQDGSSRRRGAPALHRLIGEPLAINTGNLFYCWALDRLGKLGLSAEVELELQRRTASAMLRCHQGQALDLSVRTFELPARDVPSLVRSSTELKAGTLMELAAALGGVAALADPVRLEALCEFGRGLGLALQMLDDLSGILNEERRDKAREDLRLARPTWPWAWLARDLSPGAFRRLQDRARDVHDGASPDPLIDTMALELAERGKVRTHRHLQETLDALSETFGNSGALLALRQEIERLERSYV